MRVKQLYKTKTAMSLPCGHSDPYACQDAFQTEGQPFSDIRACVEHFLRYYKGCVGQSLDDSRGPLYSHVYVELEREKISDTTGFYYESVQEMITVAWENA